MLTTSRFEILKYVRKEMFTMKNNLPLKLSPIVIALMCSPQFAHADDNEKAKGIERIQVTAQMRSQSVEEVGITINAFSGEELEVKGVETAEDIALITPGLAVSSTSTSGVPSYSIRGIGFQDYSTGASSTVGLYVDEAAIPYAVMSRGVLFDIERVEVLKGPQGDLYGRNTTAGQINFISNKPTDYLTAGIKTGVASFGVVDLEGYVSGGISESVQARLAVKSKQSSEGWQKSMTREGDTLGAKDLTAARLSVNWDINQDAKLAIQAKHVTDKSENLAPTPYDGTERFGKPVFGSFTSDIDPTKIAFSVDDNRAADWTGVVDGVNYTPRRDNTTKGLSAKLDWEIGNYIVTALASHDTFTRDEWADWDGTTFLDANIRNLTDISAQSAELRLSSFSDENFTWITGFYYSTDDVHEEYNMFLPDNIVPINSVSTIYDQDTTSTAIFGHTEWRFMPKWQLTVGARFTSEERSWTGCTYDVDGTHAALMSSIGSLFNAPAVNQGECTTINDLVDQSPADGFQGKLEPFSDTINTNKWMGKVTIDHQVNEDLMAYGTISTGFKSGGFNGTHSFFHSQLKPYDLEEVTSYELGIKATLLDGNMQLNASTFFYDYKNKQEREPIITPVGPLGGQTNVPKSEISGAELDLTWLPAEGWTVDIGLTYLDTEVKEWITVDAANSTFGEEPVTEDASGLKLAQSPTWQYSGTVMYEYELSESLFMTVAGDISYKDESSTTGGAGRFSTFVDDYTVANARIAIGDQDQTWRLSLWAKNVTDNYYYPSAFVGGNTPYVRMNGAPRTVGLTFNYTYE